ncbi:siderophore ABC transporter substrate-binding protein [Vibrio gallaecicus]|uniref:Siderophore ABC transporter substrate-binding protein n=1 Tax=Vibrio gallaecicus TaxID=552386 RepID=A0ABV4NF61_9VIBR
MLTKIFNKLAFTASLIALSSASVFAKTYEHSMGTIEINEVPQRVVVLGFGSLDFVDALGIEPLGMPKNLLPEALSKYKSDKYINTGSLQEANYETLFTLKPDLIIAEGRMASIYSDLADIAPTYMFQIDSKNYWDTTQKHWSTLGEIFNKEEKTDALITEIQAKVDTLTSLTKQAKPKALTVMSNGSNITMFGPISRFSFIYNEAGMQTSTSDNVSSETRTHGNLISFEYIADAKPDVLLILDRDQAIGKASGQAKQLFDNSLVSSTPAAKNKHITYLDPSAWYLAAGGYQSIKVMIDDLHDSIR